jgi:ABC-type transport system involved in multi-copper enzyme maturation permease subunit
MNLKSQKAVTMMSLVIYIASFLIVSGIIGGITVFFYNNTSLLDAEVYSAAEYNKLNMYLVKESEEAGNRFIEFNNDDNTMPWFEFSNGDRYTLDTTSNLLYYNSICLCEDVKGIKVETDYTSGKEVLKLKVEFSNKIYTTKYTMVQ